MIIVKEDWCKGCDICIDRCPVDALEKSDTLNRRGVRPPQLKQDNKCNYCRFCELICPDLALAVVPDKDEDQDVLAPKELGLRSIVRRIT
jgi:2-oxoglutarate ferredoxin oxidoreductase subunit delta